MIEIEVSYEAPRPRIIGNGHCNASGDERETLKH